MSLRSHHPVPAVPEQTEAVARAAFPRGNVYLLLRDRLGPVFDDAAFGDLYPVLGQPAYAPWRLALVTLMQFQETLSDRQAALWCGRGLTGSTCSRSTWLTQASTIASCASSASAFLNTKPVSACSPA